MTYFNPDRIPGAASGGGGNTRPLCRGVEGKGYDEIVALLTTRDEEEAEDGGKRLLCGNCRLPVTAESARISVNGRHRHVFRNPAGLTFLIGIFAAAAGCRMQGSYTMEYTWFPGHAWCYATCARCRAHLGWRFQGGGKSFFGLILPRLVEEES